MRGYFTGAYIGWIILGALLCYGIIKAGKSVQSYSDFATEQYYSQINEAIAAIEGYDEILGQ